MTETSGHESLPSVAMNPFIRFGSGWNDPIGKPLTNGVIRNRIKQGWYGEQAKIAALNKTKTLTNKNGFIDRCATCNTKQGVKWCAFKYLEAPAFYCPSCLLKARGISVRLKPKKRNLEEFI